MGLGRTHVTLVCSGTAAVTAGNPLMWTTSVHGLPSEATGQECGRHCGGLLPGLQGRQSCRPLCGFQAGLRCPGGLGFCACHDCLARDLSHLWQEEAGTLGRAGCCLVLKPSAPCPLSPRSVVLGGAGSLRRAGPGLSYLLRAWHCPGPGAFVQYYSNDHT